MGYQLDMKADTLSVGTNVERNKVLVVKFHI